MQKSHSNNQDPRTGQGPHAYQYAVNKVLRITNSLETPQIVRQALDDICEKSEFMTSFTNPVLSSIGSGLTEDEIYELSELYSLEVLRNNPKVLLQLYKTSNMDLSVLEWIEKHCEKAAVFLFEASSGDISIYKLVQSLINEGLAVNEENEYVDPKISDIFDFLVSCSYFRAEKKVLLAMGKGTRETESILRSHFPDYDTFIINSEAADELSESIANEVKLRRYVM